MSAGDTAAPPAQAPWPIVLYFHHVGRKLPHFTSMSVRQFTYVLDLLKDHCDVLPASALIDDRATPTDRPAVVISFDDGYADTLDAVMPLLSKRGLTAVFFVVTSEIGQERNHTTLDLRLRRASWPELRAACAAGHVIGSHGHHHEPLTEITRSIRDDLRHSQRLLSAELERSHDIFAFPYGVMPSNLSAVGFSRAFSTAKAPATHWDCAPRAIRRISLEKVDESDWAREIRSWAVRWPRASCTVCQATRST
ncbi:MAG TPA: polysaccharide deacetylase family protein [Solirubrobacteraceae bacterium]|jgi:peptidoglycan/xylan/chitin deacetylase (PgdA/CDA1 family)|nr:polysaccharide deacetylase family protein [Solirubrobacteraceae bacterium]